MLQATVWGITVWGTGFAVTMNLRFGLTYIIAYVIAYVVIYVNAYVMTYRTAYVIKYVIAYPNAWPVNFEMCLEVQLRTYQPPIPKTSQASAWCYRYIGRWMCKTAGSPTEL